MVGEVLAVMRQQPKRRADDLSSPMRWPTPPAMYLPSVTGGRRLICEGTPADIFDARKTQTRCSKAGFRQA